MTAAHKKRRVAPEPDAEHADAKTAEVKNGLGAEGEADGADEEGDEDEEAEEEAEQKENGGPAPVTKSAPAASEDYAPAEKTAATTNGAPPSAVEAGGD